MEDLEAFARDAVVLAFSIDRQWFEETSPFGYDVDVVPDDLRNLASRADALGIELPDEIRSLIR